MAKRTSTTKSTDLKQRVFKFQTVKDLYDCLVELMSDKNFDPDTAYVAGPDGEEFLVFQVATERLSDQSTVENLIFEIS